MLKSKLFISAGIDSSKGSKEKKKLTHSPMGYSKHCASRLSEKLHHSSRGFRGAHEREGSIPLVVGKFFNSRTQRSAEKTKTQGGKDRIAKGGLEESLLPCLVTPPFPGPREGGGGSTR